MLYLNKLCLFYLLYFNEFLSLVLAFTPTNTVWGHNTALADSKIYFTGGVIPKQTIWKTVNDFFNTPNELATQSKEFYYLDVSKNFKLNECVMPWTDLSIVSEILPPHSWSAFSFCGPDTLVMFGGDFGKANPINLVFIYNIKTQKWSNPTTFNQPNNVHTRAACDTKGGVMYMFSSVMNILDTKTLKWKVGSSINIPPGRFDYTATLLPNGNIVYIGGVSGEVVDLLKLPLYNINDDTWSSMDGRIIVYGGYINRGTLIPVSDDLVILDTTSSPFTWSKANVSTISPLSRTYHSATLVNEYMIVAFGRNDIYLPLLGMNEIYILDISDKFNYKWVNEFNINPVSTAPTNPRDTSIETTNTDTGTDHNNTTNVGLIIATVISTTLLILGISLLIFYYKKKQKQNRNTLFIPAKIDFNTPKLTIYGMTVPMVNSVNIYRVILDQTNFNAFSSSETYHLIPGYDR
ncbi:12116_t:CDS:2 [Entrophospora sp. SA101]|nr:12116_t:CDS:2 [Entrophospora sp. SA101]